MLCLVSNLTNRFGVLAKGQRNQKFVIADSLSPREILNL